MYQEGRGIEQNVQEAELWFARIREAAERGDKEAQVRFGLMYRYGLGVTRDYAGAVSWWRRAAEQGEAEAEDALASAYHFGHGVPEDHEEEERWLRKADARGYGWACLRLGMKYSGGLSSVWPIPVLLAKTAPTPLEARALSRAADIVESAIRGTYRPPSAQAHVPMPSSPQGGRGECVPRKEVDRVKAYMWFKAGAEQGEEGCEVLCKLLAKNLDASQIAEAERLAKLGDSQVAGSGGGGDFIS
jgi:TPR repeat protein